MECNDLGVGRLSITVMFGFHSRLPVTGIKSYICVKGHTSG